MGEKLGTWVRVLAGVAGEFSSSGSAFCADLFQYPSQRSGHSAQSAGVEVTAKIHMHPTSVALKKL